MSIEVQKKDFSSPKVVAQFLENVLSREEKKMLKTFKQSVKGK